MESRERRIESSTVRLISHSNAHEGPLSYIHRAMKRTILFLAGFVCAFASGCENEAKPLSSIDLVDAATTDARITTDVRPPTDARAGSDVAPADLGPPPDVGGPRMVADRLDPLVLGVWGASDDDVWFAGGSAGADGRYLAHFDGDTVAPVTTPTGPILWWVWGADADRVWTCGGTAAILARRDGRWRRETVDLSSEDKEITTLWGMWGSGPYDLWAVGGSPDRFGPKGLVLRSNGDGQWRRVETPVEGVDDGAILYKVWGSGPDDVHIVGERGVALHWDGDSIQRVETPFDTLLFTVHGRSDGPVLAVGGQGSQAVALRWDGERWIDDEPPTIDQPFNGVFVEPDGSAWVVGASGGYYRRSVDGIWTAHAHPASRSGDRLTTHAVWAGASVWTVGGFIAAGADGFIATDRAVMPEYDPTPPAEPDAEPPDSAVTDAGPLDARASDAEVLDAEVPDAEVPDAEVPDTAVPDAAVPDAAVPDAAMPDAAMPDAAMPDAIVLDSVVADVALSDVTVPDATVPDMAIPDAAVPDAAVPDAAVPDAAVPDAAVPDAAPDAEPTPDASGPPTGGQSCETVRCAPGYRCLGFFNTDIVWQGFYCTQTCGDDSPCPAEYGDDACCRPPGPQLIETYCVTRALHGPAECSDFSR